MKIYLKRINDGFGFNMAEDTGKIVCSSAIHYFLVPFLKSSYKYAWEACRDAWKLANKYPYHVSGFRTAAYDMEQPVIVDVSAEQMITDHYLYILRNLRIKAKSGGTSEERKKVFKEIMMVIKELYAVREKMTEPKEKNKINQILKKYQSLIQKYFQKEQQEEQKEIETTKVASVVEPEYEKDEVVDAELIGNVLDTYAEKICLAIQDRHEDIYYGVNPNNKEITIYDFSNIPLLKIKVNEHLNVESIIPVGKLYDICPSHSVVFYQRYWKPIVESLGHFCLGNPSILLKIDNESLPDVPQNNQSYPIEGWNCKDRKNEQIDISFKGEKPIWVIEPSKNIKTAQKHPSKYTEQDYVSAIVKCIDPQLKSINGRTGTVEQVIPTENMIEIDVNFGRGLGVVRLTEPQIQIVPVGV